ncbi:MAG TPA: pyruvate, phosphate dikinase [Thermomicrobiales bacterium]|nr:pyruvate, phosphate dikinase [Thermomicrobiales bacterium]
MQWIRLFSEGRAADNALLGGKGANLAEMVHLGLPIPPGFTITTEACREYLATGEVPAGLWDEVDRGIDTIEQKLGRALGDPTNPLLVSVRSGAVQSMPGMMDTILNIGLNDTTRAGLATALGERFAYDAHRRLLQMYGHIVLGLPDDHFADAISGARLATVASSESDLDPNALSGLVQRFQTILTEAEVPVPNNPRHQIREAVLAVFRSWHSERAVAYRRLYRMDSATGTAATIQAMVFGNRGSTSGTGVAFTRNPATGAPGLFGEFLINAQGEDVVAGVRTPQHLEDLAEDPVWSESITTLRSIGDQLETHFRDMQDIEFTVEEGRLWVLQTRTAKRTAQAAVRIAVELANSGMINRSEAVRRVTPEQIESILHPGLDNSRTMNVVATGLPASPGAARGQIVLTQQEAIQLGEAGTKVILVRTETAAEDFPGMVHAQGILTARGGMTSHAAVVARGMGKPAVTGCSEMVIDTRAGTVAFGSRLFHVGETIAIDGATGRVIAGPVTMVPADLSDDARTLLAWADDIRRLHVRANADTPDDARRARQLGAEGIGLCRTEHMFFGDGRLHAIRTLILSEGEDERAAALAKLEQFQYSDFLGIFRAMDGFPVTIRTLDPPLHEFLPHQPHETAALATRLGLDTAVLQARVNVMRETNPMLGHRGCRLGMTYPEITAMQARAITRAAIACVHEGIAVEPEIMIPLVSVTEELKRQHAVVVAAVEEVLERAGERIPYHVGTMIELPRAAIRAGQLASVAEFFSFGTNDLTQTTFGLSRDDSVRFLPAYLESGVFRTDPFQILDRDGVGVLIQNAVTSGRATRPGMPMGVCGEHGGNPNSIEFCDQIGLDYVSCSPFRVPVARLAAAHATLDRHPA